MTGTPGAGVRVALPAHRGKGGVIRAAVFALLLTAPGADGQVRPDSLGAPVPLAGGMAGLAPGTPPEGGAAEGITPRGALIRSLLVPGWGHAATGSHLRGGFYLLAEAGAAWMLVKTRGHLSWAREVRRVREVDLVERLRREGVPADSIPLRVRSDPGVRNARALEDARRQQQEDWVALGLFLVLLGGVDAFVSAHLQDFPEPLTVEPSVEEGRARLQVGVRLPWRGPGGG